MINLLLLLLLLLLLAGILGLQLLGYLYIFGYWDFGLSCYELNPKPWNAFIHSYHVLLPYTHIIYSYAIY